MELGDENLGSFIQRSSSMNRNLYKPGSFINSMVRKNIWRQMIGIISTLHANNTVHMDLKPDNFIVFGPMLKIADLGISRKAHVPA
jgi:serine/threonine protein kinase